MMDKIKLIEMILEEWVVRLASKTSKERTHKNVRPNFEELFEKWIDAGATRDELYETYLPKAIKAHQPTSSLIRKSYREGWGKTAEKKNEKEFGDEWNKSIKDTATEAFFEYFPIEVEPAKQKTYGNLGRAEYLHQRRLIEQFPILDTTELKQRLKDQNDDLDLEDLKISLGKEEDGN